MKVLVAGVGNVLLGDDGFGVEVVRRLAGRALPDGVRVADFGIRGVHLAHELMDGYDGLVLVDAVRHGDPPGTVSLIEPGPAGAEPAPPDRARDRVPEALPGAHDLDPAAVLALLERLGGVPGWVRVVGCEAACLDEGIGLSGPVAAAVDGAADLVQDLLAERARSGTRGRTREHEGRTGTEPRGGNA